MTKHRCFLVACALVVLLTGCATTSAGCQYDAGVLHCSGEVHAD